DRPSLARGETHDSGSAREDRSRTERLLPLAHERERRQVSGLGDELVERRLLGAEQRPDALHHPSRDSAEIEGLAAEPAQLGESLSRAAAALALRQESAVADGRARLRHEGLDDLL